MSTRAWLGLLLLAALLVRVAWCLSRPVDEAAMARSLPDQWEYLQTGRNLAAGQGLFFVDSRFGQRVDAFRTPGYPLLIAGVGGGVRAIQLVQCLLDTSTVLATFLLARRWIADRGALFAAGTVAFNPFMFFFCSLVLSETLFIAMLMWGLTLLAGVKSAGLAGAGLVILAASVLVRPSAVSLPVLASVVGCWTAGASWRRVGAIALAAMAVTVVVLLPWAARNRMVLGEWVWTSTNSGFTLYDGLNPQADGSSNQSFVQKLPVLQRMTEVQRNDFLARQAMAWLRDHPSRALELAIIKLGRLWSPVPRSDEFARRDYSIIAAMYSLPLFGMALGGLLSQSLSWRQKLFLLLPALYFSAGHALTVGSLRYRVPAEPALAVLAASVVSRRVVHGEVVSLT